MALNIKAAIAARGLTAGNGACVFDNTGVTPQRIRNYTTANGVPENNVQAVGTDSQDNVWMGTNNGVARLNIKNNTIETYYPGTNDLGNMIVENAFCTLSDSLIAFGTHHGIAIINTRHTYDSRFTFRPAITNILVNGVSYIDNNLSNDDGVLRLSHNQNSLTFHFSNFDYDDNKTAKYSFRLEGYDQDWSSPSTFNQTIYKNLPPGEYTLQLRTLGSDGQWNNEAKSLNIIIRPPLWRTWWAYLLYACLFFVIAYALWRNFKRINELRNRIKIENELTEYKMRFFTNISHEFRTPLTIIRGATDSIKAVEQVPGEMRQPISVLQKGTDRLMRMLSELMAFSKLHENRLQLAVEDTEVVAFVRDIFYTFRGMAQTNHINYQLTTTVRELHTLVDRSFIDKIAYNLISNAFKYTPANRDITVRIKHQDNEAVWQLIVEDQGVGIDKDKQKALFMRHNQSLIVRESVGIGLHLAGELVRAHHGQIAFSENPQGGSIFTVTLPTDRTAYSADEFMQTDSELSNAQQTDAEPQTDYLEMPPIPINKRTVLVVEDDNDMIEYLKRELQHYFIILQAANGAEAIQVIDDKAPDLVVTDAMMPVMNGFELIRRIRSDKQHADMPIILLTALAGEKDQLKGLKNGADVYIQKPFNPALLITYIVKLIEQRDRLKVVYAGEVVGKATTPEILTKDKDRKMHEQLDAYLQAHLADTSLSVETLSDYFQRSRTSCFQKVKQLTGMTPNEYIRSKRMEAAVELLKDEHLTVGEIAFKTGFESPYYFSSVFKQYYGVSPTKYRNGES